MLMAQFVEANRRYCDLNVPCVTHSAIAGFVIRDGEGAADLHQQNSGESACLDAGISTSEAMQDLMCSARSRSAQLDPRMGPAGATDLSPGMIPFVFQPESRMDPRLATW